MGLMKTLMTGLTLALCVVGAAVCFADDPQMGTWKLNEAKSKFAPGVPKNHTVVYETVGDNVKVTVDGTDKDGNSTHNEWTGKFDGKDYPVTGDPTSDMRSYKKVGDRVLKGEPLFRIDDRELLAELGANPLAEYEQELLDCLRELPPKKASPLADELTKLAEIGRRKGD